MRRSWPRGPRQIAGTAESSRVRSLGVDWESFTSAVLASMLCAAVLQCKLCTPHDRNPKNIFHGGVFLKGVYAKAVSMNTIVQIPESLGLCDLYIYAHVPDLWIPSALSAVKTGALEKARPMDSFYFPSSRAS